MMLLAAAAGAALAPRDAANADPTPCVAGACGPAVTTWLSSGQASVVTAGHDVTINQQSDKAILNWSNFDVAADGHVIFKQPSSSAVALNRIFQSSPSQILGAIEANGQIYLINQNGFLFGSGSRVNVGGLLASTLNITDADFNAGLLAAITQRRAVLSADGSSLPAAIEVDADAQISTRAPDERILLAAPSVSNAGLLSAPDGQVLLAAGQKLYLQASTDPTLRGLLVEVDGGGQVLNQSTGEVRADRGNVTMLGLAVNQNGRVSATTSTSVNGSIRLLARDTTQLAAVSGHQVQMTATHNGTVTLGNGSLTSVLPDPDDKTTVADAQAQPASTVELFGQRLLLQGGSQVVAPGGQLTATAALSQSGGAGQPGIHLDDGALIDLSGSDTSVPVTRNLVSVELRSNELADAPLQRDGPLRGATVVVDARVGTPLANISGYLGLTQRSVQERTSAGGNASFQSDGDLVIASGATVDVSGGVLTYTPGLMQTSQLIRADGQLVDIGNASPDDAYLGVYNPTFRKTFDRWGVVQLIPASGIAHDDPGYVQGAAAGSLQFLAPDMLLAGTFLGHATNGVYQRTASSIAAGGQFTVGIDPSATHTYSSPAITLANGAPLVTIGDTANLPAGMSLSLSADFMRSGGFSRITLNSDYGITLPAGVDLQVVPGGSLSLVAPGIHVDGSIDAPAGDIALRAVETTLAPASPVPPRGIFVGAGAQLTADGMWTNDALVPGQTPTGLVLPDAGSITLTQSVAGGTLAIGDAVGLHASGGAWLNQKSQLTGGAGGTIGIISDTGSALPGGSLMLGSGLAVDGFGVQGAAGGTFALQAPRLVIRGNAGPGLPQQMVSGDVATGGVLEVGTSLFSDNGFSTFSLTADGARLTNDAAGSILTINDAFNVDTLTRYLDAQGAAQPSQRGLASFSVTRLPPAELRGPTNLQFVARTGNASNLAMIGGLLVDESAAITASADSSLAFATSGNLDFNGSVLAPAGAVKLTVQSPSTTTDPGFVPGQHLQLGSSAAIDVSGTAILQPNDAGLLQGKVLDAGSVELTALRGSVITQPGSRIDISGTQAALDLPVTRPSAGMQRTTIASAAGSLAVLAAESASLLGSIEAYGGRGDTGTAAGGTLQLSLSRQLAGVATDTTGNYPAAPRTIRLTSAQPTLLADNTGLAVLNPQQLAASGFESLALLADDQIQLEAGVDVSMNRQLVLQSPVLALTGSGSSDLRAPYVALGSGLQIQAGGSALSGSGELQVDADSIDLVGFLNLRGLHTATLNSSGQINLLGDDGRLATDVNTSLGGLNIAGDLAMNAARIVPGTGVDFTVTAAGGTANSVRIGQTAALGGAPLSVAGSVTINADSIEQGGTLWAPFGQIALNAVNTLSFAAGSTTSVSAAGAILPYGRVDEGSTTSWVYGINAANASEVAGVPARAISVSAGQVTMAPGATIDVSGGGDVYAALWTPGTGGSRDVLAAGAVPGLYAVLPSLGGTYAPYDPLMHEGSDLRPGDSVYLAGGGGLAAGFYALLPARYALLPGAYLVQAVPGYTDIQPGVTVTSVPGATVVAGYRTTGTSGIDGGRYGGYLIQPGSYAHQLADYTDELGSEFFASAGGSGNGSLLPPSLPADAGSLSIQVDDFLDARGIVKTAGAVGARNATISIAATDLQIDAGQAAAPTDGSAHLADTVLDSWNPGTLLLGGTLDSSGNVQVISDTVSVAAGSHLLANELLLTGAQGVSVQDGAQLRTPSRTSTADGIEQATVSLVGARAAGAAVLGISDLDYLVASRPAGGAAVGTIGVASGATIESHGSILIDAPGGAVVPGQAMIGDGARWSLGADRVVFGGGGSQAGAMVIDADLSDELNQGVSLRIAANSSIDLLAPTRIAATAGRLQQIDLQTPLLRNLAGAATSSFDADLITLGSPASSPAALSAGGGQLELSAARIEIGPGSLALSGFASTLVQGTTAVVGSGSGSLVSSGNMRISTPVLTTDDGATTTIAAPDGSLVTQAMAAAGAAGEDVDAGIGGTLTLSGSTVDAGSDVLLPSGALTLDAATALAVRNGATFDVGGVHPAFAARGSPAGSIVLHSGGDITLESGSVLRVSGSTDADAGDIGISAGGNASLAATFAGADSGSTASSAAISIQAAQISGLDALNLQLEKSGFARERDYEVLQGNLVLGSPITSRSVALTADAGSLQLSGRIDASGVGDPGQIRLAARDNVQIADGAALLANAGSPQTRGGSIEVRSTQGRVSIGAGVQLSATAADSSGHLVLSAPVTSTGTDAQIDVAANLSGLGSVVIAPLLQYGLSAQPTATQLTTIRSSVGTYMATAPATILGRLGLAAASNVVMRPSLDLTQASGDLTLGAIDLTTWRFGGQAADITFRARGNITLTGTISDGFSVAAANDNTCPGCIDLLSGPASGLGFVAGADFSSVRRGATVSSAAADLTLNAGTVVRTGAADVLLAAARDIKFNTGSVYTGGRAAADSGVASRVRTTYPDADSSIEVVAGRDIVATPVTRSIAAWQQRSGVSNASWGVNFNQFNWSVGALGGGDVRLRAGRDVLNVSAAVADSARVDASGNRQHFGGGNLEIDAGRNIGTAYTYVGSGTGRLTAEGAITSARTITAGAALGSLLGAGDASYVVRARGDVLLEGVVPGDLLTPTAGPTSGVPYFVRYSPDSLLDVSSSGGNVEVFSGHLSSFVVSSLPSNAVSYEPANLRFAAYAGDVRLTGAPVYAFPSDDGQIEISAARDILGNGRAVTLLDSDAALIPTPSHPASAASTATGLLNGGSSNPASSVALRHQQDSTPVFISAGRDIVGGRFSLAKPATILAGRDIVGLQFAGQNLNPEDMTLISAGRDISYPDNLNAALSLLLAGPGQLTMIAGRDINLGVSAGVTTIGNIANGNLPESGADVTMLAGLGAPLGIRASNSTAADFLTTVVEPSADYRSRLIQYVQTVTGQPVADFDAAENLFRSLGYARQVPLAGYILMQELVKAGREVNADPTKDYSRGFAAIDALFPGSRPASGPSPFTGDLSLAFSRIYSLDGGTIELLVPGGRIDVGLANPPALLTSTTGLNRTPSQLGIVAQRTGDVLMFARDDVLVNQSRVFTLYGGDIAIWSSQGNIDAGRGAKSSISAPPPVVVVDNSGNISLDASASIAGSGIRTIRSSPEVTPGDVDLIAPAGFVNAGDAGIGSAGNLNIAAQQVLGLDNIQVGGASTGVPPEVSGLGASLSGVTAAAGSSTNAATSSTTTSQQSATPAPLAQTALSWLEVFVQGLGEEDCSPNDMECLKRQKLSK